MGLVLLAGTILLFYFAFQKMQHKSDTPKAKPVPYEWRDCSEHDLPLTADETVERIEFDEEGLTRIILRTPGDQWQIVWVHGCSGEVVGRLRIKK